MEDLQLADVPLERLLLADRDALHRELERPWIDPAGAVAEHRADLAGQKPGESVVVDRCELADGLDPSAREPHLGLRPDARELPNGERREVRRLAAGRDDGEPARLARIARDLGHDLAGRDAE